MVLGESIATPPPPHGGGDLVAQLVPFASLRLCLFLQGPHEHRVHWPRGCRQVYDWRADPVPYGAWQMGRPHERTDRWAEIGVGMSTIEQRILHLAV
jgi:hypothetical protein